MKTSIHCEAEDHVASVSDWPRRLWLRSGNESHGMAWTWEVNDVVRSRDDDKKIIAYGPNGEFLGACVTPTVVNDAWLHAQVPSREMGLQHIKAAHAAVCDSPLVQPVTWDDSQS